MASRTLGPEAASTRQLQLAFPAAPVADSPTRVGRSGSSAIYEKSTRRRTKRHPAWVPPATAFVDARQERVASTVAEMLERVKAFKPSELPADDWEAVAPFVNEVAADALRRRPDLPRQITTILTQIAHWCWIGGTPLVVDEVLHPEQVDAFVMQKCQHLSDGTRANYRSLLRSIGDALVGPPLYPLRPVAIGPSSPVAPYTAVEARALSDWAAGLSTPAKRNNTLAILGCSLGAGLTAQEINHLVGGDVETLDEGVVIHVPGAIARRVWVTREWERTVASWANTVGKRPMFRPDREKPLLKGVTNYVDALKQGLDAPRLSVVRCRTTWIVRHLEHRVPLDALARAAGVEAKALGAYAKFMEPTSDEDAVLHLRGRV